MKMKTLYYCLWMLALSACTANETMNDNMLVVSTSKNKILTLGDSRVEGGSPEFESYRYELWKKLLGLQREFDLIGPFKDDVGFPNFNGKAFDNDHGGVGGDTTLGIIERYTEAKANGIPDIVLLGIGGNDITGGATVAEVVANMGRIIDLIYTDNPSAVVLVEIIAGANPNSSLGQSLNGLVNQFGAQLIVLAQQKSTSTFKVIPVDMNTNFTNNASYYADQVHYSQLGAREIADRYFVALGPYLQ